MKNIKSFILFNESLRDKLKGKSDEEVLKSISGLSTFDRISKIIELELDDRFNPSDEDIRKELNHLRVYDRIEKIENYELDKRFMPSDKEIKEDVNITISELIYSLRNEYIVTKEEAEKFWEERYNEVKYFAITHGYEPYDIYMQYIDDIIEKFKEKDNHGPSETKSWDSVSIPVSTNESLRSKLKGKTRDEIIGNVDNILNNIVNELLERKFFFDYDKAHKFIKDRYMDELLSLIDQAIKDYDNNDDDVFSYNSLTYNDIVRLIILSFEEDYEEKKIIL
jgi:hypothetical protein